MPEIEKAEDGLEINDVMIITEEIKQVIDKLKEQSAEGPDGIPPRVLKELTDDFAVPMNILHGVQEQTLGLKKWSRLLT